MNKQKGFTIIELIVVIAIIAVLSSIVLINVSQYINKSKDARIKNNIANIALGMNACFAQTGTYEDCDTNTAYVAAALISDISGSNGNGATAPTFSTSLTAYCVSAPLASSASTYVCTDSTGVTKSSATSICATQACPN